MQKLSKRTRWIYGSGDIGFSWADLSLTGEDNSNTWPLAHHMGAKIYKCYRFYKKEFPHPNPST